MKHWLLVTVAVLAVISGFASAETFLPGFNGIDVDQRMAQFVQNVNHKKIAELAFWFDDKHPEEKYSSLFDPDIEIVEFDRITTSDRFLAVHFIAYNHSKKQWRTFVGYFEKSGNQLKVYDVCCIGN